MTINLRIHSFQCENARRWVACSARFSAICPLTLSVCLSCKALCHAHQYLLNTEHCHTLLATAAKHTHIIVFFTRRFSWHSYQDGEAIHWTYNETLCCNFSNNQYKRKIQNEITFQISWINTVLFFKVGSWTQVREVWYLLLHFELSCVECVWSSIVEHVSGFDGSTEDVLWLLSLSRYMSVHISFSIAAMPAINTDQNSKI